MLIVGLTGSIGMGKTETAKLFARLGVPVFDSDAAVHRLYAPGGAAVGPIGEAFPGTLREGAIDRQALAKAVLGAPEELKRLERLIHPLVAESQRAWLAAQAEKGSEMVVLDVPLLLETGGKERCDAVVVASAPEEVQRARVLERPGMTPEKLDSILSKQMADSEKRRHADFVVETDKGLDHAFAQVAAIVDALRTREAKAWARRREES